MQTDMDQMRTEVLLDRPDTSSIFVDTCPFDGGVSEIKPILRKFYATCTFCGSCGPTKETPEEAAISWNQRA